MKTTQSFSSFSWEVGKGFEWKILPCTLENPDSQRWMADVLTYRERRGGERELFFRAMQIPELWRRFAELDGTKQSILRFAEKYGHLANENGMVWLDENDNNPVWLDDNLRYDLPSSDIVLAGIHSFWEYEILAMKRIAFIFDLIKEKEVNNLKHKNFEQLKKNVKELQNLEDQDYFREFLLKIEDKIIQQEMTSATKARLEDYFISPEISGRGWIFDANPEIPYEDRPALQMIDKSILEPCMIKYHFYRKDGGHYPIKTQAILYFQQEVNERLVDRTFVQTLFNPYKQLLEQYVMPKDLLGTMWLQVSQAMTRGTEYKACPIRGEDFVVTRRNKAKVKFCSDGCKQENWRREQAKKTASGMAS